MTGWPLFPEWQDLHGSMAVVPEAPALPEASTQATVVGSEVAKEEQELLQDLLREGIEGLLEAPKTNVEVSVHEAPTTSAEPLTIEMTEEVSGPKLPRSISPLSLTPQPFVLSLPEFPYKPKRFKPSVRALPRADLRRKFHLTLELLS